MYTTEELSHAQPVRSHPGHPLGNNVPRNRNSPPPRGSVPYHWHYVPAVNPPQANPHFAEYERYLQRAVTYTSRTPSQTQVYANTSIPDRRDTSIPRLDSPVHDRPHRIHGGSCLTTGVESTPFSWVPHVRDQTSVCESFAIAASITYANRAGCSSGTPTLVPR